MTSLMFTEGAAGEGGGDERPRAKGKVTGDVGHHPTCSRY